MLGAHHKGYLEVHSKLDHVQYERLGLPTAIKTQHMLTYGLNRSPILAHFQKTPKTLLLTSAPLPYSIFLVIVGMTHPSLLRSMIPGKT